MRPCMMAVIVGLCLIGFVGGAMAQTQINIATVTNPDFVHTKAAVEKGVTGQGFDVGVLCHGITTQVERVQEREAVA